MKLLIDFFPIILFFVAFKFWGIYAATGVAIAATVLQIAYLRYKHGKVEAMQWVSLGVIVVFGGATLLAHSDTFIKWKPTVLYWLMGGALLMGKWVFRRNLIKSLMGAQMALPEPAWNALNWAWSGRRIPRRTFCAMSTPAPTTTPCCIASCRTSLFRVAAFPPMAPRSRAWRRSTASAITVC